jgi:hypothetical protein
MPEPVVQDAVAWQKTTSGSRQTVAGALEAFNRGDTEGFLAHFSDDMSFWMNGSHQFSGWVRGKAAFVALVGRVAAGLSKMITLEVENIIADSEWVVLEALGDATTTSGEPYRNTYCMLWRVRDRKIVEFKEYNDSPLVVARFPR